MLTNRPTYATFHELVKDGNRSKSLRIQYRNTSLQKLKPTEENRRKMENEKRSTKVEKIADRECNAEPNDDSTTHGTTKKKVSSLGIALSVAAGFLMACTSLTVKLAQSLPFYEMMIARGLGVLMFCPAAMVYNCQPFAPSTWKEASFVYCRAILGCGAMCMAYFAFQHISLADATTIIFINPVWTAILAHFLLHEKWSMFDSLAMTLSFVGVVLVARPSFLFPSHLSATNKWSTLSYVLSLVASISLAASYIFVRLIQRKTSALTFVFHYGVVSILYGFVIGAALQKLKLPDCGTLDKWHALLAGAFSFSGQVCFVYALTVERAAIVALGRATDIAFVFVLEIIVLNAPINGYSLAGSVLVILCNILIFLKKRYSEE